jgi:hypothetical protein
MEALVGIDRIHLRKILKILFLDQRQLVSALRGDIREEIAREAGETEGGGDFYAPFWFDAKQHALGFADLTTCVEERIAANSGRSNLYPELRDGFLTWWNERRRWTNVPFTPGSAVKVHFPFPGMNAVVKIEGILSIRDGRNVERYVYPYFAPNLVLGDEAARWGLWLLREALPNVDASELRILDVIRGTTCSLDRNSLRGDEEAAFRNRYVEVLRQREALREEY